MSIIPDIKAKKIFLKLLTVGGKTHDFEWRKIAAANKEDFSGSIQKTWSTYYKYNKF